MMPRRDNYDTLYRICAQTFCAGLGVGIDGFVNWSAPILGYMVGWQLDRVEAYCARKGWELTAVDGYPPVKGTASGFFGQVVPPASEAEPRSDER